MAAHYMRALLERYDQPVWEIIKQPKYKPHYLTAGKQVYMNVEIPHQLEDIAVIAGRSSYSILKSLKRLEARGKVKELHGGWQRKET